MTNKKNSKSKSDNKFSITLTEERTRFDEQTKQLLKTTHELFSADGGFDQLAEAVEDVCEVLTEKNSSAETRLENARKRKLEVQQKFETLTRREHIAGPLFARTVDSKEMRRWKMLAGIKDKPVGVPDLPKPRISVTETPPITELKKKQFQDALEHSRRVLRETLNGGRPQFEPAPQPVQPDIPENYRGGIHEEYMKLKKENERLKAELVKSVRNELASALEKAEAKVSSGGRSTALAPVPKMNFFQRVWKWFKSLFR